MGVISWSVLISTIHSSRLVRFYLFFLATTGFFVSLKIKLIGVNSWASLIDTKVLLLGVGFLLFSIFFWILTELALFVFTPKALKLTPTFHEFIDSKRKATYDEFYFKAAYDAFLAEWDKHEEEDQPKKNLVLFLLSFSVFLGLLSQGAILLSVCGFFQEIAAII